MKHTTPRDPRTFKKILRLGNIIFSKVLLNEARDLGFITTRRNNFKYPYFILNYGNSQPITTHPETILINTPEAINLCINKELTKNLIAEYMPKHYNPAEVNTGSFPLIIKAKKGHHGAGFQLFKDIDHWKKETKALNMSHYVIQQAINCKGEYRFNIFDGTAYQISRKELLTRDNGRTRFEYISLGDRAKLSSKFYKFIQATVAQISTKTDNSLSHYALDILKAKNGKYYIAEINSAPGLSGLTFPKLTACISAKLESGTLEKYRK